MPWNAKWVHLVMALYLAATLPVAAQQDTPRATVLAGLGNTMGWIGGQVEGYLANGRISGFGGAGYMPNLLNEEGNGFAGAFGMRAFTGGDRHRGLLEISLSVLSNSVRTTFPGDVVEKSRSYGPGIALGYQLIGADGLTFMLTGGVGLDDEALDPEGSRAQPIAGIGLGYTWR